mmetsp:Transcript_84840/g.245299  ORF Transcript_84840/g.245299 Transcript_84840/m.245299 type:complete len:497 (-) Transcript_84840:59-1549(-)
MAGRATSDAAIGELMQRIQLHAMTRRIRCREFFNDADPLRCGRCSEVFFHRALDMAGVKLTEEEAMMLIEHYTDHSPKVIPPATVSYLKFCADVDEVFASEELQEGMQAMMMTQSPGSTIMTTFVPNAAQDEDEFLHVLHRVAALCKARGIFLKMVYNEVDRTQNPTPAMMNPRRGGKVTEIAFRRAWPFRKEMTPADLDLICDRFRTKGGDIHYMALHNEVAEVLPDPSQPFPTSPLYLRPDDAQWSHQELHVVDKVRSKVAEKRMRLKEFFQDFDPLRKGFCSPSQTKAVFTIMNLSKEIDRQDFEQLLTAYVAEDGQFHYAKFVADVESAFTVPGLEKFPLAVIDFPDAGTTSPARRNMMRLTPTRQSKVERVEDRIRTYVKKRGAEMKPMFQDFDRANRGYISRSQFARIMSSMNLDLDEQAIALLCSRYCDLGNHNDFNWKRFLRCVDPPAKEVQVAMLEMTSPHIPFKPKPYFDARGKVLKRSLSMPMIV